MGRNYIFKKTLNFYSLHVNTVTDEDLKIFTGFNKIQFETLFIMINRCL